MFLCITNAVAPGAPVLPCAGACCAVALYTYLNYLVLSCMHYCTRCRIYFNGDKDDNVRDLIYDHVFCSDPSKHMSGCVFPACLLIFSVTTFSSLACVLRAKTTRQDKTGLAQHLFLSSFLLKKVHTTKNANWFSLCAQTNIPTGRRLTWCQSRRAATPRCTLTSVRAASSTTTRNATHRCRKHQADNAGSLLQQFVSSSWS